MGTLSGDLGKARSMSGIWRNGYTGLGFDAEWPAGGLVRAGLAGAKESFESFG
jgi:hypothetical protein